MKNLFLVLIIAAGAAVGIYKIHTNDQEKERQAKEEIERKAQEETEAKRQAEEEANRKAEEEAKRKANEQLQDEEEGEFPPREEYDQLLGKTEELFPNEKDENKTQRKKDKRQKRLEEQRLAQEQARLEEERKKAEEIKRHQADLTTAKKALRQIKVTKYNTAVKDMVKFQHYMKMLNPPEEIVSYIDDLMNIVAALRMPTKRTITETLPKDCYQTPICLRCGGTGQAPSDELKMERCTKCDGTGRKTHIEFDIPSAHQAFMLRLEKITGWIDLQQ